MAKRFSKRRSLRNHRRSRKGGGGRAGWGMGGGRVGGTGRWMGGGRVGGTGRWRGGRKKMMRTRRRTRRGGLAGNIGAATGDVRIFD